MAHEGDPVNPHDESYLYDDNGMTAEEYARALRENEEDRLHDERLAGILTQDRWWEDGGQYDKSMI